MAIYHLHVSMVSRSTGRSAVAAAAYRAGEKIKNNYDGITHDYTRKSGVVYSEIILPENAPREYENRAVLWNAVEKSEKRCDAQTARDFDIALPIEFDRQERIEALREYIQENFTAHGMCADFSIHDKEDGNPHAHIMLTTRNVEKDGFKGKNRDWNDKARLEKWRESWADVCNEKLKSKGFDERIDHRTLKAQGIDREPTEHLGVRKHRELVRNNRVENNIDTAEFMHELKQGYAILDKEINDINQKSTYLLQEMQSMKFRAEKIEERAEQIKKMSENREKAESYFKQIYFVSPDEVGVEIKRIEYKIKEMERVNERLEEKLQPLVEEKEVFALEYQRQKLLAEVNPNSKEIQEKLLRLDRESQSKMQTAQEKLAFARVEKGIEGVEREKIRDYERGR